MGRLGKKTLVDWQGQRQQSKNIPDFVERLTNHIKELPRHQRAQAYREVLRDIDPILEKRVTSLASGLAADGIPIDRAVSLATEANLKARRGFLFRLILGPLLTERANTFVDALMAHDLTPQKRAEAYRQAVTLFRPVMRPSASREDAYIRLKETHLPPDFIEWAMNTRKPASTEDVEKAVAELIDQGVPSVEAMKQGLLFAMREYTLDNIMTMGVASGTDFCAVATIVIGVVGAVIAAAGVAVGVAVPLSQDKKNREAARDLERRERERPLGLSEIYQLCQSIESMSDEDLNRWSAVETLALRYLETYRYGREELQEDEERQIRECWEEAKVDRFEEQVESREEQWMQARERQEIARAQARGLEAEAMLSHLTEVESELRERRRELQEREEAALQEVAVQRQEAELRAQQERRASILKLVGIVGALAVVGGGGYYAVKKYL